jgi:ANTAR domain-containing protein/PAS domain-containing protein
MTKRVGGRVDLHPVPASADDTDDANGLAGVGPQGVGWFRFYFDDRRWEWSEQVQRLHGYEPGTVTPTTELVLSHKHPDDRDRVAATIDAIMDTRGALSSRHRIIDTGGAVRWVVVIGDQFLDSRGVPIGTHGFYLDITPIQHSREDAITARLGEIAGKRAPIEQAKGMLMLVYGLDDNAAFELLSWLSQESNVKLRVLAEQIGATLRATASGAIVDRTIFDHALMTAHRLAD